MPKRLVRRGPEIARRFVPCSILGRTARPNHHRDKWNLKRDVSQNHGWHSESEYSKRIMRHAEKQKQRDRLHDVRQANWNVQEVRDPLAAFLEHSVPKHCPEDRGKCRTAR